MIFHPILKLWDKQGPRIWDVSINLLRSKINALSFVELKYSISPLIVLFCPPLPHKTIGPVFCGVLLFLQNAMDRNLHFNSTILAVIYVNV